MRYAFIPQTDLKPSVLCLGTASFGNGIQPPDAFRLLDRFTELGGTFIDTASVYANWLPGEKSSSEKTIGAWLQTRRNRDRLVIATKGAHPELSSMHLSRMSPEEIEADLNASLRNLQTEVIDLYWLHRDDPQRPVTEIIDTLNKQVKSGKIRYFGCSNWSVERIAAAQEYATAQGIQGFVGDQMQWSLAQVPQTRLADQTAVVMSDALWRYHQQSGLAAVPYTSQAGGWFQKMAQNQQEKIKPGQHKMYDSMENQDRVQRVRELATQLQVTMTEIILGYLLSQPFATFPIVGSRTVEQVDDSLRAAHTLLSVEQIAYLETGQKN